MKVDGSVRVRVFSQWIHSKVDEIDKACEILGDEKMKLKAIVWESSRDDKSSTADNEEKHNNSSKWSKARRVEHWHYNTTLVSGFISFWAILPKQIMQKNISLPRYIKQPKTATRKKDDEEANNSINQEAGRIERNRASASHGQAWAQ
jgi:hypothetical protein